MVTGYWEVTHACSRLCHRADKINTHDGRLSLSNTAVTAHNKACTTDKAQMTICIACAELIRNDDKAHCHNRFKTQKD